MRNPAAAHANTLGTPKVGAPSSSASGNRSKNATATTAPALKPSTHCIRAARRSASKPPMQVVQNAAPDNARSNMTDLGRIWRDVDCSWVGFDFTRGPGVGCGCQVRVLALDAHLSGNPVGVGAVFDEEGFGRAHIDDLIRRRRRYMNAGAVVGYQQERQHPAGGIEAEQHEESRAA